VYRRQNNNQNTVIQALPRYSSWIQKIFGSSWMKMVSIADAMDQVVREMNNKASGIAPGEWRSFHNLAAVKRDNKPAKIEGMIVREN